MSAKAIPQPRPLSILDLRPLALTLRPRIGHRCLQPPIGLRAMSLSRHQSLPCFSSVLSEGQTGIPHGQGDG